MIKVGIVEDNAALRSSIARLINSQPDMQCILATGSLHHIVTELVNNTPEIILQDIDLPAISGIDGVKLIKNSFPEIQVLMFTVFEEDDKIFAAIKNGASGYLLKKTKPEEIISAIKELKNGGAPMSASIARKVIQSFQNNTPPAANYNLTSREKEILNGLTEGMSYKKIAEINFISISTVRTHICSIYEKLHVNSKAAAVAKVLKNNQG
jgi:DNA-binding NarL/FixJ family response regulator